MDVLPDGLHAEITTVALSSKYGWSPRGETRRDNRAGRRDTVIDVEERVQAKFPSLLHGYASVGRDARVGRMVSRVDLMHIMPYADTSTDTPWIIRGDAPSKLQFANLTFENWRGTAQTSTGASTAPAVCSCA